MVLLRLAHYNLTSHLILSTTFTDNLRLITQKTFKSTITVSSVYHCSPRLKIFILLSMLPTTPRPAHRPTPVTSASKVFLITSLMASLDLESKFKKVISRPHRATNREPEITNQTWTIKLIWECWHQNDKLNKMLTVHYILDFAKKYTSDIIIRLIIITPSELLLSNTRCGIEPAGVGFSEGEFPASWSLRSNNTGTRPLTSQGSNNDPFKRPGKDHADDQHGDGLFFGSTVLQATFYRFVRTSLFKFHTYKNVFLLLSGSKITNGEM